MIRAADFYHARRGLSTRLSLAWALAWLLSMPDDAIAQTRSLATQPNAIRLADRPACAACRLLVRHIATLGTDSLDGYLSDNPLWASMDQHGVIYVGLQPPGGPLLSFDTTGRFLGRIGGRGRGPGEFQLPVSAVPASSGRLLIWDFSGAQLTVLDSARRFQYRVYQPYSPVGAFADGRQLVSAPMTGSDGHWYTLHIYDDSGKRVDSFGRAARGYAEPERWRLVRRASIGPRGTIWAADADRYVVNEWSMEGQELRTFFRSVVWMPPVEVRSAGVFGERPNAHVVALVEDESRRLWVFSRVPATDWQSALGPATVSRGRASFPRRDQGRLFDTMVDVIDLGSDRLIVSERVAGNVRFVLSPDPIVVRYREKEDGTPLLDVLRISMQATDPGRNP